MSKDKTGVQLNQGHTSTDDFLTKKYVLPLLPLYSNDAFPWSRYLLRHFTREGIVHTLA